MPRNSTEVGQRRSYEFRGKHYPSVTTLLKAYPMEWAIPYGAKYTALRAVDEFPEFVTRLWADKDDATKWLKKAPFERRDAAGDHGTDLHGYLEGRLTDKDAAPTSPGEVAVEQFLATYRPDPLFIEAQVVSVANEYAGSFDAIVDIYGRRLLLDLKTSATYDPYADRPSKAGGDHKDRLQLAAYRHADIIFQDDRELGYVPEVDGCAVLAIPRDHPHAWRLIEVDAGPATFSKFLTFANAFRWYDDNKDTPIGSQVLPQAEDAA
jgi:hypothetical protein